jgi:hypothetical protein
MPFLLNILFLEHIPALISNIKSMQSKAKKANKSDFSASGTEKAGWNAKASIELKLRGKSSSKTYQGSARTDIKASSKTSLKASKTDLKASKTELYQKGVNSSLKIATVSKTELYAGSPYSPSPNIAASNQDTNIEMPVSKSSKANDSNVAEMDTQISARVDDLNTLDTQISVRVVDTGKNPNVGTYHKSSDQLLNEGKEIFVTDTAQSIKRKETLNLIKSALKMADNTDEEYELAELETQLVQTIISRNPTETPGRKKSVRVAASKVPPPPPSFKAANVPMPTIPPMVFPSASTPRANFNRLDDENEEDKYTQFAGDADTQRM